MYALMGAARRHPSPDLGGTATMSRAERRITVAVVVRRSPRSAWGVAAGGGLVTMRYIGILIVMYTLAGLESRSGFTDCYHTGPSMVRAGYAGRSRSLGSMAAQGAVIHWVAHHRKHHAFADEDGDPHSPHVTQSARVVGACARYVARAHRMDVRPRPIRLGATLRTRTSAGPNDQPASTVTS